MARRECGGAAGVGCGVRAALTVNGHARTLAIAIAAVALASAATALWLFPRALPILALEQKVTRDIALARADSFFRAHELAPTGARTTVRFQGNDSLRVFVELAGGGHDSLSVLVRGKDVAPFLWSVRAFAPGNPREARVHFAPDGRLVAFSRTLAESDKRPEISADSGRRLAEQVLGKWIDDRADRWRLVTSSYDTKKTSGRIDRTYTFERVDRRIGGAPIRIDVVVAGDLPVRARPYVEIPESFRRRYGEMRSANQLLSLIASLGILAVAILGVVFLSRSARAQSVRWREPLIVGTVIGALTVAAGLNEMPGSWYGYDTAVSPVVFQLMIGMGAAAAGALTGLVTALTLAAAESTTRHAFPQHLDWWKLWRYRGTTEVAAQVAGGYAAACVAFAYVAVFYLATRTLLGWWVPSELLDDPNQIASPLPWISGIATSLNAGVWEEALFRALPLSILFLWAGGRPARRRWMAAGVVVSALIFGFAHSDYASWPPYSRGVEIFLDACFWAVLFLHFGILVTIVAHFVYNLVLFGLFAASGSATEYRISAAIILLALLAPALAVAWRWVRQGRLTTVPDDARFAAWTPGANEELLDASASWQSRVLTSRGRQMAAAAAIFGLIVAVARPPKPTLGPQFSAERARVLVTADSMVRARGGDPAGWTRLTSTATDTLAAWPRFLREHKLESQAQHIGTTYHPPAWWVVRYVHTLGTVAQRTEEWRIRLWPNGRPLDTRHLIPDSASRAPAEPADVRRIALSTLAREGVDTARLLEAEFKETARPTRRDVTVTYTDTAVRLPAGAAARAWVQVAGDEPLVARRGVELPETFLRADRERQSSRTMIAGLCALILVGGIITGATYVTRRRAVLIHDDVLDRRATFVAVGALAVLAAVEQLNALPSSLFSYDTTQPWTRFLGTTALGFVSVIPLALFLLGIWIVLGALRRRVGIPMLGGPPSRSASNDMLVGGLGLGAITSAMLRLDALVPRGTLPRAPTTSLDEAVPWLSGIAGIPQSALMIVAFVAIPILVVAAITPKWWVRALIAAAMTALLGTAIQALAPPGDADPLRVIFLVATVAVVSWACYAWAALGAWTWIIGALVFQGLGELRQVLYAPTVQEKWAGMLSVVVIVALVALIARRTRLGGYQKQVPGRVQDDDVTAQARTARSP